MTPKQTERLKTKISGIKRTLAAERRKFGGYDDSRGLRYLPAEYFVQLQDYKGGQTYLRWFSKAFPDDAGFPYFLFEWTIILFQCGRPKEAEKKAFETFCANTYLFDRFFGRPVVPADKSEGSNLATADFADYLDYSSQQPELAGFSKWLEELITSIDFRNHRNKNIDIHKKLKHETDPEARGHLVRQASQLKRQQ